MDHIQNVELAKSLGISSEDLDDLVHDCVSQQASDINNGGLSAQIEYLNREIGVDELAVWMRQWCDDGKQA